MKKLSILTHISLFSLLKIPFKTPSFKKSLHKPTHHLNITPPFLQQGSHLFSPGLSIHHVVRRRRGTAIRVDEKRRGGGADPHGGDVHEVEVRGIKTSLNPNSTGLDNPDKI
jgi:hypothetical protein